MFPKTVSLVGAILMASTFTVNASIQEITFFKDYGCSTGRNETFIDNQEDLSTSWITNASSLLIVGLWKIHVKEPKAEDGTQRGITIVHYYTQPPGGRCINKNESDVWVNNRIYYAEIIGPSADTANSEIQFYTETFYQGLQYKASGDLAQVGPKPFAMLSYIHFSNETWTVYSEKDFKGHVVLLFPFDKVDMDENAMPEPEDSYTYSNKDIIIVGSIRKGSHDDHSGASVFADVAPSIFLMARVFQYFL